MDLGLIDGQRAYRERGFTLIELMIVVAVIAILALVVVPTFFKESRKTKSSSEVAPMFAEIQVKEEQYKVATGLYLATAACPATPSTQGTPSSGCVSATDWTTLRLNPPNTSLYCSYTVTIGSGIGTSAPTGFTWDSPAADWYYMEAQCDLDGDTSRDAHYFMASSDPRIQKYDEGF